MRRPRDYRTSIIVAAAIAAAAVSAGYAPRAGAHDTTESTRPDWYGRGDLSYVRYLADQHLQDPGGAQRYADELRASWVCRLDTRG